MAAKKIPGAWPVNNREKAKLLDDDPRICRARQCELLELKRTSSYYKPSPTYARYGEYKRRPTDHLRILIFEILEKNPGFGLRRCVPLLKERYGIETTYNKLRHIMEKPRKSAKAKEIKKAEESPCSNALSDKFDINQLDDTIRKMLQTVRQRPLPKKWSR